MAEFVNIADLSADETCVVKEWGVVYPISNASNCWSSEGPLGMVIL